MSEESHQTNGRLDPFFKRWADITVRYPFWILLAVAIGSYPFVGSMIRNFDVQDNSQGIWFPKHDLSNAYYDAFKKEFESDELVSVAIESRDGVFNPDTLAVVRAIQEELDKIINIEETDSILTMNHVQGKKTEGEDGEAQYELVIEPLLPEGEDWTPEQRKDAETRALADENFVKNLISPDGTFTAIFGRIVPTDQIQVKAKITEDVKEALRGVAARFASKGAFFSDNTNPLYDSTKEQFDAAPRKIYLAGVPIVDYEFDHLAEVDQKEITGLSFGTIFLVLLILFRSLTMAVLPLIVMFLSLAFAFGGYALTGGTMNMLIGMGGPVLIAACVGESVHLLSTYYGERRPGVSRAEALRRTILDVYWPCFFTAFTTAIGFLSFAFTYMPPMMSFGLTTAAGCAISYVFAMTVIPAAIIILERIEQWIGRHRENAFARLLVRPVHFLLREPDTEKLEKLNSGPIRRMLDWVATRVTKQWRPLLITFVLVTAATFLGIAKIKVETNNLEFIPATHYVRYTMEAVQEKLTGLSNIEIVVEGDPGIGTDPEVLQGLDAFITELRGVENVPQVLGPTSYLKQIHRAMNGDDPAFYKVPDSKELIAQYLLLAELSGDKDLKSFINYDYSKIRASIRSSHSESSQFDALLAKAKESMARNLPRIALVDFGQMQDRFSDKDDPTETVKNTRKEGEPPQYKITGLISLYGRLNRLFVSELLFSFFQAFLEIYVCMVVLTRSFKMGAIAMLPNLFPIFITGGLMGIGGYRLDAATILIASIALGIAVDDTVHYVSRMPIEFKRTGGDYIESIKTTHATIGRALVSTSIILILGFGVMMMGAFMPTRRFGGLTALTMFLAIIGEMIYTPVFYMFFKPLGPGTPDKDEEKSVSQMAAAG
ncbi:MAG: MMPL family transporter [Bdellovibrionota bacterium]